MLIAALPVPRPAVPFTPRLVTDPRVIAELLCKSVGLGRATVPSLGSRRVHTLHLGCCVHL